MSSFGRSGAAGGWVRTGRASRLVFVSYSHADHVACRRFLEFLRPLCDRLGDQVWVDEERLDGGDLWRDEIGTALGEAQVFIVLMSQKYRASDFCMIDELAPILRRHTSDGVRVIGIALHELTLKDFSVRLDATHSCGLDELQCLPQGVLDEDGVSRRGLKPMSKWTGEADAWHQVQVQLEHALSSTAGGCRPQLKAAAPPQPVADPDKLAPPYLCDRHTQCDDLAAVLEEWHGLRCSRPLVILSEGADHDCLPEWVQRMSEFEIRKALPRFEGGDLAFDPKLPGTPWPENIRDEVHARRSLIQKFSMELGLNASSSIEPLHAELCNRMSPTLWWTELFLSYGEGSLLAGMRGLSGLLSGMPTLTPQRPLVLVLNVVHDSPGSVEVLRGVLHEGRVAGGFHFADLGRLPPVSRRDLNVWATARHVQPRLPRPSIDTLRDRLTEPKPMREFARLYYDWAAHG